MNGMQSVDRVRFLAARHTCSVGNCVANALNHDEHHDIGQRGVRHQPPLRALTHRSGWGLWELRIQVVFVAKTHGHHECEFRELHADHERLHQEEICHSPVRYHHDWLFAHDFHAEIKEVKVEVSDKRFFSNLYIFFTHFILPPAASMTDDSVVTDLKVVQMVGGVSMAAVKDSRGLLAKQLFRTWQCVTKVEQVKDWLGWKMAAMKLLTVSTAFVGANAEKRSIQLLPQLTFIEDIVQQFEAIATKEEQKEVATELKSIHDHLTFLCDVVGLLTKQAPHHFICDATHTTKDCREVVKVEDAKEPSGDAPMEVTVTCEEPVVNGIVIMGKFDPEQAITYKDLLDDGLRFPETSHNKLRFFIEDIVYETNYTQACGLKLANFPRLFVSYFAVEHEFALAELGFKLF